MEHRGPTGRRSGSAAGAAAGARLKVPPGRPDDAGGTGPNAGKVLGGVQGRAHAAGGRGGRIGESADLKSDEPLLRASDLNRGPGSGATSSTTSRQASVASSAGTTPAPLPDDILGGLSTAVLIVDPGGTIVYLNAGAEDLLGVSVRHSLGRTLQSLLPNMRQLDELVRRTADEGEIFGQMISITAGHTSETPIEVACHVSPAPGTGHRVIIELSDATHWRQIDREHALIAQREASRRMIRQLAHEIRNPLGGLRGAAQLLERELPTPELREFTRIIIGEADRLTSLTDNLLGPVQRPQRQDVNVHEVLERVVGLIASERREAVQLFRDYDPSLPPLFADSDQLIQALLNIARNALQSVGPDGHVRFRTRALTNFPIGAVRHKLVLSIEVEDDGPGIPPELAESIFYPLVTGRPDGTGLGLPISQDLVSRHGGLIEFQSRPGKTIFMVRLPFDLPETV